MVSDEEVTAATARLDTAGGLLKLTASDADEMVTNLRLLIGPLESSYPNLEADLLALDDTANTKKKAAKMAAVLVRLKDMDFSVSLIDSTLVDDDNMQRRLFLLYAFGLPYPIPLALSDPQIYLRTMRRYSQTVDTIVIP